MATTTSSDPVENPDTDQDAAQWLTGGDVAIAAIPQAEHQAAIHRILIPTGFDRDQDGHLRRAAGAGHE